MAIADGEVIPTEPVETQEYRLYAMTAALEAMTEARDEVLRPGQYQPDHGTQAYLMEASLGAFVELGELVNCTQWKPWRQYREMTPETRRDLLDEWADVQLFLTALRRVLGEMHGFTARDFAEAYLRKTEEVGRRFRGEVPGKECPNGGQG